MNSVHWFARCCLLLTVSGLYFGGQSRAADNAGGIEFFENRIRPVLVESCYECHNSHGKKKGGLAVDYRDGLLDSEAVVPGRPGESILITAIDHSDPEIKMPKGGAKLEPMVVADFRKWIEMGAPDPRDAPPTAEELADATSWETTRERRKQWWSFQPIKDPQPPAVSDPRWSKSEIDRFIYSNLSANGLEPAIRANKRQLVRRVTFGLTGLPPTPEEIDTFLADETSDAYANLVDRLLASPHFGERWARHWMDWYRYADSHGSEGDPAIHHAWQYRDYLIRALNADIPYDQLIREHLAGDLLEKPRVSADGKMNESAVGPAHFRFVFHGFAPTDALDEQVRFTDNQIDVVSKAMLGLTVSCARCHNHKFDAISQADFYALYGIFASCRPAIVAADSEAVRNAGREEMRELKAEIRKEIAGKWIAAADGVTASLKEPDEVWKKAIDEAKSPSHPLNLWRELRGLPEEEYPEGVTKFEQRSKEMLESIARLKERYEDRGGFAWSAMTSKGHDYSDWSLEGEGVNRTPSRAGKFSVSESGDSIIRDIYPSGFFSHAFSTKDSGFIASPRMTLDGNYRVFARIAGDGKAIARYVVQNYPRNGTVYPVSEVNGGNWRWQSWGLKYWEGDQIHFELTTAADSAVLAKTGNSRSWVGLRDLLLVKEGDTAPKEEVAEALIPLMGGSDRQRFLHDRELLAERYAMAIRSSAEAWREGSPSDFEAMYLSHFMRAGLLPNKLGEFPEIASLVERYRELEAAITVPTRVPGIVEGEVFDQPLFDRGNHKKPKDPVPRRFLEALGGREYSDVDSGRLELAEDVLSAENPFTSRVVVNRIWHHLFGQGIVATPDNFGKLGEKPTHPQLLDHLALEMVAGEWSMKKLIREIVLSETYQLGSVPPAGAGEKDPQGSALSHFPVRRLDAESIRDAILSVSGQLDRRQGGPMDGDNSKRRSVYRRVQRNNLDPFLTVFDAPEPLTTRGRRSITNVPGQSLTLMNDPKVIALANGWATQVMANSDHPDDAARVRSMFTQAFARPPSAAELSRCLEFLGLTEEGIAKAAQERKTLEGKLAHARSGAEAIFAPAKEKLLATQGDNQKVDPVEALKPIAAWEFEGNLRDEIGDLHAEASGTVKFTDGALVLDGNGHVLTGELKRDLVAKTLEAVVQLDGLDQKGGGAITVETPNGDVFDSIVFAEIDARHWLAGSDRHSRTLPFAAASAESTADKKPVHLAIVYAEDGTITGYRNGEPYGKSFKKGGLNRFAAGQAKVVFGLRHSPAGSGRLLRGRLFSARVYDRALSSEEVRVAAGGVGNFVSRAQVIASLEDTQRAELTELESEIANIELELAEARNVGAANPQEAWRDLAQSIFSMKEFIYLR